MSTLFYENMAEEDSHYGKNGKPESALMKRNDVTANMSGGEFIWGAERSVTLIWSGDEAAIRDREILPIENAKRSGATERLFGKGFKTASPRAKRSASCLELGRGAKSIARRGNEFFRNHFVRSFVRPNGQREKPF